MVTEAIAKKLHAFNVATCVSLDGPEEIHDRFRLLRNNTGSFQKVLQGIRLLQEENHPIIVEATVMIEKFLEYDRIKLLQYFDFFATIGVSGIAFFLDVNERELDEELQAAIKRFYCAMVDYYFDILQDEKKSRKIVFTNVLSTIFKILNNKKASPCLAGLTQVFTSVSGDIYPCQIYFAAKHSKLGNICDIELYQEQRQHIAEQMNERKFLSCIGCNYYNYCENKCPGSNLLATGTQGRPASAQCFGARCLVDHVIYNLGLCGTDPVKNKKIVENLNCAAQFAEGFSA